MTSFLAKSCFRLSFILRKAGVHCPVLGTGETTGSVGDDNGGTQVQSAAAGREEETDT